MVGQADERRKKAARSCFGQGSGSWSVVGEIGVLQVFGDEPCIGARRAVEDGDPMRIRALGNCPDRDAHGRPDLLVRITC